MVALRRTVERHRLPIRPFLDLIDAFEQDQRVTRYRTWEEVIDYCRRSANPVGRIVLHLGGYPELPENAQRYAMSDSTCTALQLTNFWQDVRRDLVERDRVYLPSEDTGLTAAMLSDWMTRSDDPAARVPYIKAVRKMVERTWPLFHHGAALPQTISKRIRPVVWLFGAGGRAVLRSVERTGCATLWERPRLGKMTKASLVGRAWLAAKMGRGEA
jgi:phytoene/squalene synthetase